jgi:hypothetical protein
MRYPMPNFPCEFEIPDDCLDEAGIAGFACRGSAYRAKPGVALVPSREIEPPYRKPAIAKDWRGFDRARMISILKGFVPGTEIEPVSLRELPVPTFVLPGPYGYQVREDFHRFYASILAGFERVPALTS